MVDTKIITSIGDWIYNLLHTALNTLRNNLGNNTDLIFLIVAILFAYYFNKKAKEGVLTNAYIIIILSIIFFMLLKYI